jgi:hypothetical protein
MAAGTETRLWSMEDVVVVIDEHAERHASRFDRLASYTTLYLGHLGTIASPPASDQIDPATLAGVPLSG